MRAAQISNVIKPKTLIAKKIIVTLIERKYSDLYLCNAFVRIRNSKIGQLGL